jgi:hypothetical protein
MKTLPSHLPYKRGEEEGGGGSWPLIHLVDYLPALLSYALLPSLMFLFCGNISEVLPRFLTCARAQPLYICKVSLVKDRIKRLKFEKKMK